jgi:hypothetical protein
MKSLLLLATLISANSFAATVSGSKALTLRKALLDTGATAKLYSDATFLSVTNVVCIQNSGIVLLPFKCQYVEEGRLIEADLGKEANNLANALKDAGAKVVNFKAAELARVTVSAKSVDCSSSSVPKTMQCTVK